MKFSSLFLLALPLASAHGLKARQDATETANEVGEALSQADPSNAADCLTICSMAAMADSCAPEDSRCLCNDDGWTTSLTTCNRVCTQNIVGDIFYALKEACKRVGAPPHSEPPYGWTLTESSNPVSTVTGADGSVSTVSCSLSARSDHLTNSAIAAASSVIVHTTWPTSAAGVPTSGPSSSPAAAEVVKTTSATASVASATAAGAGAGASAAAGTTTSGAEMMRVGGMGLLVAVIGGTVALGI
ncbi:hypothetical protein QFC20_006791 [Naganishia adeliensis]|uniref:Uncharacterized protein n=1 Tax=Naganishia adeliensis TaxID=92952 RepID=A0ACC2V6X8_9TREE|nr:hypothetical protein QFC20_006791 [Naganishia adeliensis]